jgi:anaerobic magnesium-protoporphyrin IX monomethyl ester cyclase
MTSKSHVVLVNSSFLLKDGNIVANVNQRNFPLGLGLLGTILVQQGYSVELVNANIHQDWESRVLTAASRADIAFIGFGCMSSQVYSALRLSKEIKKNHPEVAILFGGVHPTLVPASLVRTPWVDYCVVGEGDAVVLPFMDYLNGKCEITNVPNICTTGAHGDLITTGMAALSSFAMLPDVIDDRFYRDDVEKYFISFQIGDRLYRGFSILTGLGCKYRCAFCINTITKRAYRSRTARSIYGEMKYLNKTYQIDFFNFQEEHFFGDRARLSELLELIENDPVLYKNIAWNTTIRLSDICEDYVNVDLLKRIKASGGYGFGAGGESGSDRMLKKLRKGIQRKDIMRAVKFCNEAQVTINLSFVMMWPEETFEDMVETARMVEFVYEAGPYANVPYFQTYRPYPGSIWERDLSRYEDPENLPDNIWRFQAIDSIKKMRIENAETIYKLVSTTQFFCLAGQSKYSSAGRGFFKRSVFSVLYRISKWRIATVNYNWYLEGPLLSYVLKKATQY